MVTIYVYVLDTMADWELGHVTAELHSGRFFKKDAPDISIQTVGNTKEQIKTMGGLTVVPDCTIEDIVVNDKNMLILPGADTWSNPMHSAIIKKASEFLSLGGTVCAICGATVALANVGLLNNRRHTSNGQGFLDMFSSEYQEKSHYIDEPSVTDGNLITAGCTGGLLWAKQIIEHLGVFRQDTLNAWYDYFCTGKAECFYALMNTLQS